MPKTENGQLAFSGDLIIEQFINNKNDVLEKVYKHNYKIVRSYVLKNNGLEADAKDVFQEAMMIAWMNMKEGKFTIKNEFSLSAYIYKIAKYKWIDRLKSKEVKSTQRIGEIDYGEAELSEIDIIDSTQNLNYLNQLFSQLNSRCKEVLKQFYYQKLNLETIATNLKYDLGSIRTIKYRCMQKLRSMHTDMQNQMDEK